MKRFVPSILIIGTVLMSPAIACANAGPAIFLRFQLHFVFLTWFIGLGEGLLLCTLFRAFRLGSRTYRIFVSMIAANIVSAWLGMRFVNSPYAARIMGDVTIENLIPAFWTMVYVTFVLTMIIEFPFFLVALYGRKWLIPKALAATIFVHCISYSLLFFFYRGEESINMVTELDVVPASTFEMKEDYDLYYISSDGKQVMRSDLAGNDKEVIATLNMEGIPDRLCARPRKVSEEVQQVKDKKDQKTIQPVCGESGFDLYVLLNINGTFETRLLVENFTPCSALSLSDFEYKGGWDRETERDFENFRSFGDAEEWEYYSYYWGPLVVKRFWREDQPYTTAEKQSGFTQRSEESIDALYRVDAPFMQWSIRNGTEITGDYGVFKLGKDQICILDPEKKRIALIARGFGPVVAKPPLAAAAEAVEEQTANEVP